MGAARSLALAALAGLLLAALAGVAASVAPRAELVLDGVHGVLALYGFLLPTLAAFTAHTLHALLGSAVPARRGVAASCLWGTGAVVLATGQWLDQPRMDGVPPPGSATAAGLVGLALLAGAAVLTTVLLLKAVPKREGSTASEQPGRLGKGDDASCAHLRFAQFILPLGVLLEAASRTTEFGDSESGLEGLLRLSGVHLLAVYAVLTCYGMAHLWAPRLSGAPAASARAIKGELHVTLLGALLLSISFIVDDGVPPPGTRAMRIAGGVLLLLGALLFMCLLGASVLRRPRPRTPRVAPPTHLPWAFAAALWLIAGVLLGIYVDGVEVVFNRVGWSLSFAHVHITLLGGVGQLLLALAWVVVPAARGAPPPPFKAFALVAFLALNGGLALLLAGHVQVFEGAVHTYPTLDAPLFLSGAALIVLGLAASLLILARPRRALGGAGS